MIFLGLTKPMLFGYEIFFIMCVSTRLFVSCFDIFVQFDILICGSKSKLFITKILRKTQENVDQSGESKAPLGWQVVRTKGVANQSWPKTFSKD